MTLKHRVHTFQSVLLALLREKIAEEGNTPAQLAAIGVMIFLAEVIEEADNKGAFDDDVSEVREEAPAEG